MCGVKQIIPLVYLTFHMNFFIFVDENSVNCIKSDGKVELLNMDYIELSFFLGGGGGHSI